MRNTFVDVDITENPRETRVARTQERVGSVGAGAVRTRIGSAFVNIRFTVRARITSNTRTVVAVDSIVALRGLLAGIRLAFVQVGLADRARKPCSAIALEAVDVIDTSAAIQTRRGLTLIDIAFAVDLEAIKRRNKKEKKKVRREQARRKREEERTP
jgi:hypothetical protein